jgi:hypothetical protein
VFGGFVLLLFLAMPDTSRVEGVVLFCCFLMPVFGVFLLDQFF